MEKPETMNIVVVGGGRMGLPLACVFADNGGNVTVADVRPDVVEAVNAGRSPYEEPGLDELVAKHAGANLRATTQTTDAVREADAIVVIVPALLTGVRDIDYSVLLSASRDIGKGLRRGALVAYETTVSVGGTRHVLVPALEEAGGLKAGADFSVAFSPERVKANLVIERLRQTPKVVGGWDDASLALASAFYSQYLGAPVIEVGMLEAAEMSKLADMLYRDVNIALVNELAAFAEAVGVDFARVREAANTSGEAQLLIPGIGVGGHCTPVYPYFITHEAERIGVPQRLSVAAREINDGQPARHVARLEKEWGPVRGRKVHILGLSFRPEVKVDTLSPAYALRDALEKCGAIVTLEDPLYRPEELRTKGFTPSTLAESGCQAVFLNTAHRAFARADFAPWHAAGIEVVVDGRNLWNPADVARAGMLYLAVGRPRSGGAAL